MKYVWVYLTTSSLGIAIASVVYLWFPATRGFLLEEDSLIENLSAIFFLSSCCFSLWLLLRGRRERQFLLLISGLSLLGFLDELSFGERLFGLAMPEIDNVKIDAVHDLFSLAYDRKVHTHPLLHLGILLIFIFVLFRAKFILQHIDRFIKTELGKPHYLLLLLSVISVLIASVLDLEIRFLHYGPVYLLEELFEMNAGLALLFCGFSLKQNFSLAEVERK